MPRVFTALLLLTLLTSCGTPTTASSEPNLPWPEPDAKKVTELKAELRAALPAEFKISNLGPWVIATDMDAAAAQHLVKNTISKCAAAIQRQLFTLKPRSEPVKVYLFKDGDSYNKWNRALFGEKPISFFGYFSRAKNALVMNIGTGGGTLVHEMVHAMAEVDYPNIPAWLNEGLGSLFEACSFAASGKAIGVTNWRLKGLKEDIAANKEVKLDALIGMSDTDFYGPNQSSNYAAMRYFMQWMQEQGKLEAFYTQVRDKKDGDPKKILQSLFENKMTLAAIQKKYSDWVNALTR